MAGTVIDDHRNLGRSMTHSEATPSSGAIDRLAGLVDAAEGDQKARRRLLDRASRVLAADAEAERRSRLAIAEAEQRARAVEADAEARIRAAEAKLRVQERERAASRAEREAERAEQASIREAQAELAALRRAKLAHLRELAGAAAPATLSMLVYLAAVASAVFGQVSVATGRYSWPIWRALLLAAFIELMALAMALTSNRLRLRGERAFAPRVLTWVFAGFAAGVNVWGHWTDPLMAAGLGAASLGGITLWEIRSSARHRDALRVAGQLGTPLPPLGMRFWILQPRIAMAAYRIAVRTRVSQMAAPLIAQAEAERALRRAARNGRGIPAAGAVPQHQELAPRGTAHRDGETSPSLPGQTQPALASASSPDAAPPPRPSAVNRRSAGAGVAAGKVPAVLSPTGEFRALTAPDHYGRNGIGGDERTASAGPGLGAAQRPKRAPQKRSGIPAEARTWITEYLQADKTPTGPEVGRQFRVDASTGRRWVRQVRESLAAEAA